ncbi:hypothetical protein BGZ65_000141 [Modicella reniformis]|uniref:Vacuolar import and degradation protein n=1 Tax=Modicella reniformis TaxID=1440133 RepID=A0A9P6SVJ8_9FUNG|nr:hypothetical protein BGZ65_000141 [Modicella reniformis]
MLLPHRHSRHSHPRLPLQPRLLGSNNNDNNSTTTSGGGGKSLDWETGGPDNEQGGGIDDLQKARLAVEGDGNNTATTTASATATTTVSTGFGALGSSSPSSNMVDNTLARRIISTTISSLPPFVSSVFTPRTQGSGGRVGVAAAAAAVGSTGSPHHRLPPPLRSNHPRRQCCFLQPGQKFSGTQNLKTHTTLSGRARQNEEWDVKVTISAVDYDAGAVYGLMEAMDVPLSASNVVTFWEGEIIDFENHTFWTKKWATKAKTDLEHWKRLEAFQGIDEKYIVKGAKTGRFRGHVDQKYIFMRWKEKHFVNSNEHTSGLTIAGFYYVAMRRSDGYVEGYYHDQQSTPFQHLCLNPVFDAGGFSSSIFEVA